MEEAYRRYPRGATGAGTAAWTGWVAFFLGVWVFLSPLFTAREGFYFWDNLVLGAVAAVVSIPAAGPRPFQGWVGGLSGVWLFMTAWIPPLLAQPGKYWNGFIVGILLMIAGGSGLGRRGPLAQPPPIP